MQVVRHADVDEREALREGRERERQRETDCARGDAELSKVDDGGEASSHGEERTSLNCWQPLLNRLLRHAHPDVAREDSRQA